MVKIKVAARLFLGLVAFGVRAQGAPAADKSGCNFGVPRAANDFNPFAGITAGF
jgi:hypothetical protein